MTTVAAFAKINLSLRVGPVQDNGLHRVDGLYQSIDLRDLVRLTTAESDAARGPGGSEVVDGWDNLAWKAATLVRDAAGAGSRLELELTKRIPVAAGLGGGSADAAAGLVAAGSLFGVDLAELGGLAPRLGSDVPFALVGGTAYVSGTGERVLSLEPAGGWTVGVVTPPIEVSTAEVFAMWDRLEPAAGPVTAAAELPPSLREYAPLVNDLYGAAVAVAPSVDEWRAEMAARWDRPVLMTGSGPSLFAFFLDAAEAADALAQVPLGARAAEVAAPIARGWELPGDHD